MPSYTIRAAKVSDAESIANIYAPYVENTCISFEETAPTAEEFEKRIKNIGEKYPYLVCETDDGKVLGYAYASAHGERAGYKYSANASVYVMQNLHGRGVGRALYEKLFELLLQRNIYTVFASVSSVNGESAAFHKAMGFVSCGLFVNVAYKHGQWLNLEWFSKPLRNYSEPI